MVRVLQVGRFLELLPGHFAGQCLQQPNFPGDFPGDFPGSAAIPGRCFVWAR